MLQPQRISPLKQKCPGIAVTVLFTMVTVAAFAAPASPGFEHSDAGVSISAAGNVTINGDRSFFVSNEGQFDDEVRYYARTKAGSIFVTRDGHIVYVFIEAGNEGTCGILSLREQAGSIAPTPHIVGREKMTSTAGYFRGTDPSTWVGAADCFKTLDLGELWEGTQLQLRMTGAQAEKLFHVEAGADPDHIRMTVEGTRGLRVSATGELVIHTDVGEVSFSRPIAYQAVGTDKRNVEVSYSVSGKSYGFSGAVDITDLSLLIDNQFISLTPLPACA